NFTANLFREKRLSPRAAPPSSAAFRSHMFKQAAPRWIALGGFTLACGAGCINAIGLLGAQHHALSHMSGTVTNVGTELARGEYPLAVHAVLVIVFFFLGCVLSGMIIRHSALRAGRRYGVALSCESALLFAAAWLLHHGAMAGDYLAAMAC